MMRVLSLYDSSPRVSNSAIASSNACPITRQHVGKSIFMNKLLLFRKTRIKKVSNLFGEIASAVRRIENLIIENREIECQSESNGVSRSQLGVGNVLRNREKWLTHKKKKR